MNENLSLALELLGIGMLTVFVVLLLVVFIGNAIIQYVNRFMPEEAKVATTTNKSVAQPTAIDGNKMAGIVSAVQIVTEGKGKVVKIEKI